MNVEKSQCLAHLHKVLICSSWLFFHSTSFSYPAGIPVSACTNCHSSLTMFGELGFRSYHLSSYSLGMRLHCCLGLIWITAYYTNLSLNCFQFHVADIWADCKPSTILIQQHQTSVQNWRFYSRLLFETQLQCFPLNLDADAHMQMLTLTGGLPLCRTGQNCC